MAKLSITDAARVTGVSRVTLHRYIKAGKLSRGCIGKKGATYAARFRDVMNDWGVSRFWASTDRGVAA
jgi:predicted site-specific integrase-resolvase